MWAWSLHRNTMTWQNRNCKVVFFGFSSCLSWEGRIRQVGTSKVVGPWRRQEREYVDHICSTPNNFGRRIDTALHPSSGEETQVGCVMLSKINIKIKTVLPWWSSVDCPGTLNTCALMRRRESSEAFSSVRRRPDGTLFWGICAPTFSKCLATGIPQGSEQLQQITMTRQSGRPTDLLKADHSGTTNCGAFSNGRPIEEVSVIVASKWRTYLGEEGTLEFLFP